MSHDDFLRRAPNLLIVSSNGAGFDPVDVEACTKAGVLVVNQSGGNAHSVAEHALGMLLTLSKRIIEADRALRRDRDVNRNALIGTEAQGKTIGIVGIGNVGRRIAELCKGLLGMNVLAYDPYLSQIRNCGARRAEGRTRRTAAPLRLRLDQLPADQGQPRHDRRAQFALMQPHAYFITTARGFIHDEDALLEALRAKKIAGAGLDVWSKEPPPPEHPLLQFDNVLASPHTAGVTSEARENMGRIAAEQILDALDGKRPPRIINPEVWPHLQRALCKDLWRQARLMGRRFSSAEPGRQQCHFPASLDTVLGRERFFVVRHGFRDGSSAGVEGFLGCYGFVHCFVRRRRRIGRRIASLSRSRPRACPTPAPEFQAEVIPCCHDNGSRQHPAARANMVTRQYPGGRMPCHAMSSCS